jgi:hypothetical protein
MSAFDQVSVQDQQNILNYFRRHERREPDTSGIFVCTHCGMVQDDFSGEKVSRDVDVLGCKTFCKVCGRMLMGCDPDRGEITCPVCDTPFEWRKHEPSGFTFFMPPPKATLLEKAPSSYEGR